MSAIQGDLVVKRNTSTRSLRTEVNVVATSAATMTLTVFAKSQIIFTGSTSGQVVSLPDSSILEIGHIFWIRNRSTTSIEIQDSLSNVIVQLYSYQTVHLTLQNGGWAYSIEPELLQDTVGTSTNSPAVAQTIAVPTDSVLILESKVLGVRTGGASGSAGDSAFYQRTARFKNVAGTVTKHSLQTSYTSEDQATWDATFSVNGTDIEILVTGAVDNDIDWFVSTQPQLITF